MNNLRKFSTEADYTAATLNYPAVSWVTGTDTVHFDKESAVNNKVKIAFTTDACGEGKYFNLLPYSDVVSNIDSLTVNGAPYTPASCGGIDRIELAANTDYLIEYELKDGVTNVYNWFVITAAEGCSSTLIKYDILFPAQVTTITGLNDSYLRVLIFEETTPPNLPLTSCSFPDTYVPDSAVNTYKSVWSSVSSSIHPISEYSGNIPT